MEETSWTKIDPSLRAELTALLEKPNDAFHSDFKDAVVWWLFLLLLSVGGAGAAIWDISTDPGSFGFFFQYFAENPLSGLQAFVTTPHLIGLLAALIAGPWAAVTWVRNIGRRGLALTDQAIVLVRGPRLKVLPIADVASASARKIRTRKQTFTVLTAKLKDGRKHDFYCHGRWAELAMRKLPADPSPT